MVPWTQKHAPKKAADIVGQDAPLVQLRDYVQNFSKHKGKALLLWGPSGCGKTISVHAIAKEFDYELIEINASDFRNKDHVDSTIGNASKQRSLFSKGKIILVDEVDGLSGMEDRGGIGALTSLIATSGFPMVCTATDPFDQKFADLRKSSRMVEYAALSSTSIFTVLRHIADIEKMECPDDNLKSLARQAGGDLRAALTDLQILTQENNTLTKEDIEGLGFREQSETIITALLKIFKTTDPNLAINSFDGVDEDLDKCILWLEENLPKEYEKPIDLARAFDSLSKADVMKSRIRRWQHWRFLVYVNAYVTAGVAVAKDAKYAKFTQYQPPMRILKLWQGKQKYEKRKGIMEKVAGRTHSSSREALQSFLPHLQIIFQKNKEMADTIAADLDLSKEEVQWLKANPVL